jgi:hypothetical protein
MKWRPTFRLCERNELPIRIFNFATPEKNLVLKKKKKINPILLPCDFSG